ncbi:hypothetical protein [Candidatus Thioglobus sp.]|uniref:hypothetical protein n=1 Tax=Candidatus Thioglobus sp. TaxID=2026721 RepID=UPI003D0B7DFA
MKESITQLDIFPKHYVDEAFNQFPFVRLCLNLDCSVPHFSKNKRSGKGNCLCEFCDSVTVNINKSTFIKNIDSWNGICFNFYDENNLPVSFSEVA